jgi:prepilin peptidase CpaA
LLAVSAFQGLLLLAVVVSSVAAVWDYKTGLIPNAITYPLVVVGAILHFAISASVFSKADLGLIVIETLAGVFACALVPLILWKANAMGGGDVKLLAGLGAALGPRVGITVQVYAFSAAALLVPIILAYRGVFWATMRRSFWVMIRPFLSHKRRPEIGHDPMAEVRFGPAIALGTMLVALLEWS